MAPLEVVTELTLPKLSMPTTESCDCASPSSVPMVNHESNRDAGTNSAPEGAIRLACICRNVRESADSGCSAQQAEEREERAGRRARLGLAGVT